MLAASTTSGPLLLGANHFHAKPSDRIAGLPAACTFPGISFEPLGSSPG
jgi:hypothetical protein